MLNAKSLALWAAVFLAAANAVPCKPCNNGPRPQLGDLTGAFPIPFSPPVPLPDTGSLTGTATGMASDMTGGTVTPSVLVVGGAGPLDAAGSLGPVVGGDATRPRGPLEISEDHLEDLAKVATGEKDPLATLEEHAADDAGLIQNELGGGTAAVGAQ
ncbi:uncharacterized protein LAJ45_06981 [Morchella importuna]|uniref:uncharacterized protein n=1 Tax=Morchella importuna TaxID=1174673 RepID=UPI001E8CFF58|nr:uncharacterized protein LAJ45_06981 [Morchella importuna]KAH8149006.1 hypothetical protein LAJ45_06981 [Morchella importuna]